MIKNERNVYSRLYNHQKESIDTIQKYLEDDTTIKQALIKMPTGTGKTAIIAYSACILCKEIDVLVVTTSLAVKNQLVYDISNKVWNDIGVKEFTPDKQIVDLSPSNVEDQINNSCNSVFVTTVQSIEQIYRDKPDAFLKIKEKINVIFFDEGHREPANVWRKIIREISNKIVLLTATPVRNDNNLFQIDGNYIYNYSFQRALNDGYIRNVIFHPVKKARNNKVNEFIDSVLFEFQKIKNSKPDAKVIIRCGTPEQIKEIVKELQQRSQSVAAVHHTFQNDGVFFDYVPDVRGHEATYWVHQNMLIEGVDNHAFSMLAIFHPFDNARMLVQQIGRIIRKKRDHDITATVLYRENDYEQKNWWNSYLLYEECLDKSNEFIVIDFDDIFNKMTEINPKALYLEGKFLERLPYPQSGNNDHFLNTYKIPLKANVYELPLRNKQKTDLFYELVNEIELELDSYPIVKVDRRIDESNRVYILIYAVYQNSPILSNHALLEMRLGIMVFKLFDEMLFYFDSNRISLRAINTKYIKMSAKNLKKVFSKTTRFMSISINNGLISESGIRRMIMYSNDMGRVPSNITHHYHYITTAQGIHHPVSSKRIIRRYVGFKNARVTESTKWVSLERYFEWIDEIYVLLKKEAEEIPLFNRYATFAEVPDQTEVASILISLDGFEQTVGLEDRLYDVVGGSFDLMIRGKSHKVFIEFDATVRKYILRSNDPIFISYDEEEIAAVDVECPQMGEDLIQYLNNKNSFQLLLNDREYVYNHGEFHRIGIPADEKIINAFTWEYELKAGTLNKEKGTNYLKKTKPTSIRNMWEKNSLFEIIATLGIDLKDDLQGKELKEELNGLDYLFCSDLGNEVADFIGINERESKVIFIHCKCDEGSWLSVQAFYDICAQIQKNVDFVNAHSNRKPDFSRWDKPWNETVQHPNF